MSTFPTYPVVQPPNGGAATGNGSSSFNQNIDSEITKLLKAYSYASSAADRRAGYSAPPTGLLAMVMKQARYNTKHNLSGAVYGDPTYNPEYAAPDQNKALSGFYLEYKRIPNQSEFTKYYNVNSRFKGEYGTSLEDIAAQDPTNAKYGAIPFKYQVTKSIYDKLTKLGATPTVEQVRALIASDPYMSGLQQASDAAKAKRDENTANTTSYLGTTADSNKNVDYTGLKQLGYDPETGWASLLQKVEGLRPTYWRNPQKTAILDYGITPVQAVQEGPMLALINQYVAQGATQDEAEKRADRDLQNAISRQNQQQQKTQQNLASMTAGGITPQMLAAQTSYTGNENPFDVQQAIQNKVVEGLKQKDRKTAEKYATWRPYIDDTGKTTGYMASTPDGQVQIGTLSSDGKYHVIKTWADGSTTDVAGAYNTPEEAQRAATKDWNRIANGPDIFGVALAGTAQGGTAVASAYSRDVTDIKNIWSNNEDRMLSNPMAQRYFSDTNNQKTVAASIFDMLDYYAKHVRPRIDKGESAVSMNDLPANIANNLEDLTKLYERGITSIDDLMTTTPYPNHRDPNASPEERQKNLMRWAFYLNIPIGNLPVDTSDPFELVKYIMANKGDYDKAFLASLQQKNPNAVGAVQKYLDQGYDLRDITFDGKKVGIRRADLTPDQIMQDYMNKMKQVGLADDAVCQAANTIKLTDRSQYWGDQRKTDSPVLQIVGNFAAGIPAAAATVPMAFLPPPLAAIAQASYWATLGYGQNAEEARLDGATAEQQTRYGLSGALVNAGFSLIPGKISGGDLVKTGARSALSALTKRGMSGLLNLGYSIVCNDLQQVAMNAVKKGIYKPDMAWTGEGGVIDAKQLIDGAINTVTTSFVMSLLHLGAGKAFRYVVDTVNTGKRILTEKALKYAREDAAKDPRAATLTKAIDEAKAIETKNPTTFHEDQSSISSSSSRFAAQETAVREKLTAQKDASFTQALSGEKRIDPGAVTSNDSFTSALLKDDRPSPEALQNAISGDNVGNVLREPFPEGLEQGTGNGISVQTGKLNTIDFEVKEGKANRSGETDIQSKSSQPVNSLPVNIQPANVQPVDLNDLFRNDGPNTIRDKLLSNAMNVNLKNSISEIYRRDALVGDGGLADAIRHELSTGKFIGGKSHIIKGIERVKNLQNIVTKFSLSSSDLLIAQKLISEIQNSLGGK